MKIVPYFEDQLQMRRRRKLKLKTMSMMAFIDLNHGQLASARTYRQGDVVAIPSQVSAEAF